MNKRQRLLLIKLCTVMGLTIALIVGLSQYRSVINKSEAIKSMNILSMEIAKYHLSHEELPPKDYIEEVISKYGLSRIGSVECRSRWIEPGSGPETILLFSKKNYKTLFVKPGYVYLTKMDMLESEQLLKLYRKKMTLKNNTDSKKQIAEIERKITQLKQSGKDGTSQWADAAVFEKNLSKQQNEAEAKEFIEQHIDTQSF